MNLVFTSVFEGDLAELSGYFCAQAGPDVSRRFEDEVCRLVELLLRQPELGRQRHDLTPSSIRSFVVPHFRNYVLFYQWEGDDLKILRLRFGGMDLPAMFNP